MGKQDTRTVQVNERPKTGNISSLSSIARELAPFFNKRGYKLNFSGLTETYDKYTSLKLEDIFGLWDLVAELEAWQTYLEEILNISLSYQMTLICGTDYLETLRGDMLMKYSNEIVERKNNIRLLKTFEKELENHIKHLSECSSYCKSLFNKQVGTYRKKN